MTAGNYDFRLSVARRHPLKARCPRPVRAAECGGGATGGFHLLDGDGFPNRQDAISLHRIRRLFRHNAPPAEELSIWSLPLCGCGLQSEDVSKTISRRIPALLFPSLAASRRNEPSRSGRSRSCRGIRLRDNPPPLPFHAKISGTLTVPVDLPPVGFHNLIRRSRK